MNIEAHLDEMKNIHNAILYSLGNEVSVEENFQNLTELFYDSKISENKNKLKLLLHIFAEIANNYHRSPNFFSKIEQILQYFKFNITNYFPNWEIFNIYKSNKRILLFLIEEKILFVDDYIIKTLNKDKYISEQYHLYLAPEIIPYIKKNFSQYKLIMNLSKNIPSDFSEKRKKGENDNAICKIIQNDLINDFIKENIMDLNTKVSQSIFETNSLILKNQPTLIEYAAFFGSIQIFKVIAQKF